ncbi:hypothetical protein SAMN05444157_0765 [Frankineae bacterium MT45]|nr:hypothetical protein SAMN05444157_0765 [Frankineae bacterium MT45]
MDESEEWFEATVDDSGVCTWSGIDAPVQWASVAEVANQYWSDSVFRRAKSSYGPAQEFVASLTSTGSDSAIDAIQALVDAAVSDDELDFIGAGPLEDLLAHGGHGAKFVDEIERRARQQPRFRQAVAGLWLSADVPENIRSRLAALGAKPAAAPASKRSRTR